MIIPDELYIKAIRQALIESGFYNTYVEDVNPNLKPSITIDTVDYYKSLAWSSFYQVDPFVVVELKEINKDEDNLH